MQNARAYDQNIPTISAPTNGEIYIFAPEWARPHTIGRSAAMPWGSGMIIQLDWDDGFITGCFVEDQNGNHVRVEFATNMEEIIAIEELLYNTEPDDPYLA
jgi:hypothetical protein